MRRILKHSVAGLALATALPLSVQAATITGWNTGNVVLGSPVTGTESGASVVYDRAPADSGAVTNGKIYYAAPEAGAPGLRVSNEAYTQSKQSFDGCILASSTAECDSDFQSGKRFKEHLTDTGPVDLVFDVEKSDSDSLYQVFHRLVNLTGQKLDGFSVQLGTGVGSLFTASTASDGLSFSSSVKLGPNDEAAFSQYPFGLFGSEAQPNPNPSFTLGGFFDATSRSGFNLTIGEDKLESTDFYGAYGSIFGSWLDKGMTPEGLLWDYASGAADPLVMAWDNGLGWEVRRGIKDEDGILTASDVYALDPDMWQTFAYDNIAGVSAFLSGIALDQDIIEDLANLNVNYAIALGKDFMGSSFTLRVESVPAPVPLPAAAPLLLAGFGALGFAARRRRRRAA